MTTKLRAIFSDIDGTLVHYAAKLQKQGYDLVRCAPRAADAPTVDPPTTATKPLIELWLHKATDTLIEALPVPSATLGGGYISVATLELVKRLRSEHGVKFCVLTGARTSTFVSRCESGTLPEFDFGVCEGGGKIYSPDLQVDENWINRFVPVIGPWKQNQNKPPEQRGGVLWDCLRVLVSVPDPSANSPASKDETDSETRPREHPLGSNVTPKIDANSFSTAFMVDVRPSGSSSAGSEPSAVLGVSEVSETESRLRAFIAGRFPQLTVVVNLGKGHISAKGCTKAEVVEYLCREKFGFLTRDSTPEARPDATESGGVHNIIAALFDDENDLDFARKCHIGFAPGIAHPAVSEFLEQQRRQQRTCESAAESTPPAYRKCPFEGFLGTQYALEQLLQMCQRG